MDIRLGKNAAAGSNIVDVFRFFGKLVQFVNGHVKEYGHLVKKSPCPAGTVPVHAQVTRAIGFDVDNLGVFPTNIDEGGYFRVFFLDKFGRGDDFLLESKLEFFRNPHANGARHFDFDGRLSDGCGKFGQLFLEDSHDIGLVPLVTGENNLFAAIQNDHFSSSGTNVQPYLISTHDTPLKQ